MDNEIFLDLSYAEIEYLYNEIIEGYKNNNELAAYYCCVAGRGYCLRYRSITHSTACSFCNSSECWQTYGQTDYKAAMGLASSCGGVYNWSGHYDGGWCR